jgi:hypothetical protein
MLTPSTICSTAKTFWTGKTLLLLYLKSGLAQSDYIKRYLLYFNLRNALPKMLIVNQLNNYLF